MFDTTGENNVLCIAPTFPGVSVPAPSYRYGDGSGIKVGQGVLSIRTNSWSQFSYQLPPDTTKLKALPRMHSITRYGVTCGVDGTGATACIDPQGRAFMLSSAWSGSLPHVTAGQTLTAAPIHCTQDAGTTSCKDGDHGFVHTMDPPAYRTF
ncbi:hypothetical protein [Mycobacteroides salmoniphilum]|nr:hypothetical protein [Mycobacteroides salmoniphilum]